MIYTNSLKTPEEIELGKKRHELAGIQSQLVEFEHAFNGLRSEIRMFERVYDQILGKRISELEDLEWQLNGLLGHERCEVEQDPSERDDGFAQFHYRTDLLDEEFESAPDMPKKSLKTLYREVAKAIHPDLSPDDDERVRRQELMAVANQAYEVGDRKVLEDILFEWEKVSEPVSGCDIAIELVRVIRQIARVQQSIFAVRRQIDELKATDIYRFKIRVDEALADGIDLMAEMAATVDMDISKTRKRLAALRGENEAPTSGGPPLETRLVHFPTDHVCGTLYERSNGSVDYRDWQRVGHAKGVREVFLDKALRLDVKGSAETELRFLDSLKPDDLQALFLHEIDNAALMRLTRLSGLQELYISNTRVTDDGLALLKPLQSLRRLYIYHTAITDAGLANLMLLPGLRWLTCSGTSITESGLDDFRKAVPSCKAVSFEWRFGKQAG